MKLKIEYNHSGIKLRGKLSSAKNLLYAEAEFIKNTHCETLLPCVYLPKGKGYEFLYHVGIAAPLRTTLERPVSLEYLESMLRAFLLLAQTCDQENLSLQRVVFDKNYLFFDPALYTLRFVYLPSREHVPKRRMATALDALESLVSAPVMSHEETQHLASTTLDYVRRSTLFSWPDFEQFLKNQKVLVTEPSATTFIQCISQPSVEDTRTMFGYDFIREQAKNNSSGRSTLIQSCDQVKQRKTHAFT